MLKAEIGVLLDKYPETVRDAIVELAEQELSFYGAVICGEGYYPKQRQIDATIKERHKMYADAIISAMVQECQNADELIKLLNIKEN